jgi:hypothetical protein
MYVGYSINGAPALFPGRLFTNLTNTASQTIMLSNTIQLPLSANDSLRMLTITAIGTPVYYSDGYLRLT